MMKKILISAFAAIAMTGAASIAFTATGVDVAHAQSAKSLVDTAKAKGEVGEQIDGYLGVVPGKNPSSATRNAVKEINIGRNGVYRSRAKRENVSTEAMAASIGVKQLQKARAGETVKDASGQWKTK